MRNTGLQPTLLVSLFAVGAYVHAQESEEALALAAVHATLTGRWEGQIEGMHPITDEAYTQSDVFTFTVTDADTLATAWWTDAGLILYEHRGGGNFHARTFGPSGPGFEEDLEISVPLPIDDAGNGTWIVTGWAEMPDGTEIEIREIFTIAGAELTMVAEQRPRYDEAAEYRVIAEARYERAMLQ